MSGVFVTGTDTGVGKTILSACLIAAIVADGGVARAHKPIVTGVEEPAGTWPQDHVLLGGLCHMAAEEVAPLRYGPAVSPHLAQELAGVSIEGAQILAAARDASDQAGKEGAALVVEGVGGLLVPLAHDLSVRQLAVTLGLPLLIAARPGLGTINHALLSVESARSAGLDVRAVVITPWPVDLLDARPSGPDARRDMLRSNRETIARLGEVEVAVLPEVRSADASSLAAAGAALPWRSWLR